MLSFGSPGPQAFDAEAGIPMARDANERLYETMKKHPTRFEGFAALPTADPQASADELERTVKKLGFKGAMIHGHQQGSFLDDKKYWVIWERAVALDVPIYLHPRQPSAAAMKAYFDGYEDIAGAPWGFAVDWGDRTPLTSGSASGQASPITAAHTYAAPGSNTARVTVTDKDGGAGSATTTVTVTAANRPPTAAAGGPYTGTEGAAVSLDGSGSSDLDGDALDE